MLKSSNIKKIPVVFDCKKKYLLLFIFVLTLIELLTSVGNPFVFFLNKFSIIKNLKKLNLSKSNYFIILL